MTPGRKIIKQCGAKDSIFSFLEFGGGIGEGAEPEEKRPNLAGIIKKTLRRARVKGTYLPAINSGTLREAARS